MTSPIARIALILPLVWIVFAAAAWGGASTVKAKKKKKQTSVEAARVDYSEPVAVLSTPEKRVQVYRLVGTEAPHLSYMVVRVEDGESHVAYGDEHTVGDLVASLTGQFKTGAGAVKRCPAAISGWRFEHSDTRVSFCAESAETDRIERAVTLLETLVE